MASVVNSFAISGIEAYPVEIETKQAQSQAPLLGYQVPSQTKA